MRSNSEKRSFIRSSFSSWSSSFRLSKSYSLRSESLLSRSLYFFFCSSVRSVYWITGTSFILSFWAAASLQCPARMTKFSSTKIGALNQSSLMLFTIFFTCSSVCILLFLS
nr:MAG TPA: hypothetical protein [Caudoviricetes sp.]